MTKEVATINQNFVALNGQINIGEVLQANLGHGARLEARDLEQIKMPGAGGTNWTIVTSEGEQSTPHVDGIILHTVITRVMWHNEFGGGPVQPPDCYSGDGKLGVGDPGGVCLSCPYAQFGSSKRAQKCKQRRVIFFLRNNSLLPSIISAPPGSLKQSQTYLLRLANEGVAVNQVITRMSLSKEKNADGIPYAQLKFAKIGPVGNIAEVKRYIQEIMPFLSNVTSDYAATSGQDGE